MTKAQKAQQTEAITELRAMVRPGDTVYTQLQHVSKSGMQRVIQLVLIRDNEPLRIGRTAARAMGDRWDDKRQGIVVGGCGMDMGFHLVYNLARTLFRDAFTCIGERCPSNDHNNAYYQERDGKCVVCGAERNGSAETRKWGAHREYKVCSVACAGGEWLHSDGGYALNHKWL